MGLIRVLVRYADDVVIVVEQESDAHRVLEVLPKRLGRGGLTMHPEKSRLGRFRRPRLGWRPGPARTRLRAAVRRAIMEEPGGDAGRPTGGAPGRPPPPDGDSRPGGRQAGCPGHAAPTVARAPLR